MYCFSYTARTASGDRPQRRCRLSSPPRTATTTCNTTTHSSSAAAALVAWRKLATTPALLRRRQHLASQLATVQHTLAQPPPGNERIDEENAPAANVTSVVIAEHVQAPPAPLEFPARATSRPVRLPRDPSSEAEATLVRALREVQLQPHSTRVKPGSVGAAASPSSSKVWPNGKSPAQRTRSGRLRVKPLPFWAGDGLERGADGGYAVNQDGNPQLRRRSIDYTGNFCTEKQCNERSLLLSS